jgi:Helix-loop-helix DNA-binding domain
MDSEDSMILLEEAVEEKAVVSSSFVATFTNKSEQRIKSRRGKNSKPPGDRKMERKVAHRFVERRRRSKLNDEFTALRDLIPTCSGRQEMHKLAILQVSEERKALLSTTDYLGERPIYAVLEGLPQSVAKRAFKLCSKHQVRFAVTSSKICTI